MHLVLSLLAILAPAQVEPEEVVADIVPPVPVATHWKDGPSRYFLATAIDVGFLYFRPRVSLGYGRPHYEWFGVDANPIFHTTGLGAYSGLRLAIPHFDVRAGARFFLPFSRSFLQPRENYSRLDLEDLTGPRSRYVTLEAEATATLPIGPGRLLLVAAGSAVELVPEGYYVFEETIRVIAKPPFIWRTRFGYGINCGPQEAVTLTPVVELVGVP